jgi:hypothetical protein
MARRMLSESSMSMYRTIGKPRNDIVSCRWISVITVAWRFRAIFCSERRRRFSSTARCSAGWRDARTKNSHSRLRGSTA